MAVSLSLYIPHHSHTSPIMESPNESLRDDWQARLINLLDDSLANQETEIGSLLKTHQDALVEPNEWLPDEDAVRRSARFLVRRDVSWVEFLKSTVDSFGSLAHSGVSLDTDGKGRRILTACDRQIKMMSDLIEIGRPGATAAGIWGILTGVNSTCESLITVASGI